MIVTWPLHIEPSALYCVCTCRFHYLPICISNQSIVVYYICIMLVMDIIIFYFLGCEDVVQCFYCGLKLRNWDVFDCPWLEHARHRRDCPHVYNVKGENVYKRLYEVTLLKFQLI
jgi:hypothetical protein